MVVRSVEEAFQRAVDEARIALRDRLVAEAELLERAGAEVFGEDVRAVEELAHDGLALGALHVHREAFLVAVEHREKARARMLQAARVVALERLDLDHLGTEVGEHQAARGPHHHVRELDDADALQGQALHAARLKPFGRPASGVCPYTGSSGIPFTSSSRAFMSLSKSIPVVTPMLSNMKTRSSVITLPLAPGANGQPPSPPIELSKWRTPSS